MIDWSKQHCGVHQAPFEEMLKLMPDLLPIMLTFPEVWYDFTWDVKVHMLMPNQFPCIPNWHVDNVPRVNGVQDFTQVKLDKPMYVWVSGPPFTEFQENEFQTYFIKPEKWYRFTQSDRHRGTMSTEHCWRGFIRATHVDILKPKESNWLRRHSQVYLDSNNFKW